MSEVKAVYGAMAKATRQLAAVGVAKNDTNESQGFNFRGIDAILGAMSKVLADCGLIVLPRVVEHTITEITQNNKLKFRAKVNVQYLILSTQDGSDLVTVVCAEAVDSQDKATSKALSMAYKYFAFQTFCIPLEGVLDDADAHSPMQERDEEPAAEAPKKRTKKQPAPADNTAEVQAAVNATLAETAPQTEPAPAGDAQSAALLKSLAEIGPGATEALAELRGKLLAYKGQQVFSDIKAAYKAAQERAAAKPA